MHIACAASEQYAPHCAAMLHSLLAQHPRGQCHIHYLHVPDLPEAVKRNIESVCHGMCAQLSLHPVDASIFDGLPVRWHISVETWYRLLLPRLLPDVERVLYIDADAIVTAELDALWQTDMGEHSVAAVDNAFIAQSRDRVRKLGLGTGRYFNGGVLLLDLARLRAADWTARALDYAQRHADTLALLDQDVMNILLGPHRLTLSPRWNCQNSVFYFTDSRAHFGEAASREATENPAIVHFEGPGMAKPWHYLCKHPYRDRYFAHRRQTPWPRVGIEGRTLGARLLRPLPASRIIQALELQYRGANWLRRHWHRLRARRA